MPSKLLMPPDIAELYFDFDWDRRKVWALSITPEPLPRSALEWHLDLPFWSSRPPEPLFDLQPRRVIDDPTYHAAHERRIALADMSFPIDVMEHRGRLCVMDGLHRLARAVREGRDMVSVRRIPRSAVPLIRVTWD
ncbi:MAG: hypothetical protein KC668_08445 [Myxococcales bacterium]|nr:hypothetical protein [Myxococcales bacterium]